MARKQAASGWTFRVSVSPSPAKLAKLFGEAGKDFSDFRPAWAAIAPKVEAGIKRIVASRGSSIGLAWPGLRDKYYLARKARKGWSAAELKASGRLLSSVKKLSSGRRTLKVGVRDVPYAKAVQWGTGVGNIRVGGGGARVFVALDDQAKREASEELNAHVNGLLSKLAQRMAGAK